MLKKVCVMKQPHPQLPVTCLEKSEKINGRKTYPRGRQCTRGWAPVSLSHTMHSWTLTVSSGDRSAADRKKKAQGQICHWTGPRSGTQTARLLEVLPRRGIISLRKSRPLFAQPPTAPFVPPHQSWFKTGEEVQLHADHCLGWYFIISDWW